MVYGLILISCAIENIFPPSPSDVFVAMAAFLSHQGHYDPVTIFITAWVGGMAGAIGVYALARRHADQFRSSRIGQKLLPVEATAFFRKEYTRFGAIGLFLTRLLPGFRSVVAPIAGLSHLGAWQTLIPIALAVTLWYATLTFIGAKLGTQWDRVLGLINGLNQTLGVLAIAVLVLVVGGILWWKRKRRRALPTQ